VLPRQGLGDRGVHGILHVLVDGDPRGAGPLPHPCRPRLAHHQQHRCAGSGTHQVGKNGGGYVIGHRRGREVGDHRERMLVEPFRDGAAERGRGGQVEVSTSFDLYQPSLEVVSHGLGLSAGHRTVPIN
jgi:hypothetical protein